MAERRAPTDRRASRRDRRRLRDRKKNADTRSLVIELTETDLRVAILERNTNDGADQVDALSVPWRNEATSPHTEQGREELTLALRSLVEAHGLAGCPVRFVLGSRYCVTKAIVGPLDEVRSELQQLKQRSQLYLLLGTGEKVMVSNSKSLDARHAYAVASICHAKTLDTLREASERTGLRIESIEPALVANSRAISRLEGAPDAPTVMIHMDHMSAEIGIAYRGRILLEYRPGSCNSAAELVGALSIHLGRLERHVSRVLGEASPKLKQVYLTGDRESVAAVQKAFARVPQMQSRIVNPADIQASWQFSTALDDPATVPVLGAMLGTYLPAGESDAPNFMDHITAISREPLKPVLIRSLAPIAAVLLLGVCLELFNLHQLSTINGLQVQLDELAVAQARARELNLRQTASHDKLLQLNKLDEKLDPPPTAETLRRIAHCMPSDVWLTSLIMGADQTLALRGSSFLETGIFDFVRWLEQAPGFEHVALRGTKSGHSQAGPTVDFDVQLVLGNFDTAPEEVARHE